LSYETDHPILTFCVVYRWNIWTGESAIQMY